MGKKNQSNKQKGQTKQEKAFLEVSKVREKLISSLEKCTTEKRLNEILDQYNADIKKGLFRVNLGNFKSKFRLQIEGMNDTIDELIESKKALFASISSSSEESAEDVESDISVEDKKYEVKDVITIDSAAKMINLYLFNPANESADDSELANNDASEEAQLAIVANNKPKDEPVEGALPKPAIDAPDINTPKAKNFDPKRVFELAAVKQQLNALSDKSAEFNGKLQSLLANNPDDLKKAEEYRKAKAAINSIHHQVQNLYNDYIYGDIDLNTFKEAAKPLLDNENEHVQTLQSHRGTKQILINLLAFILTAGVGYGIAAIATRRFMVFNPHTDSSKKADDLLQSIHNAQATPAA